MGIFKKKFSYDDYRKQTSYPLDKINKMNNYTFLNENYCEHNQMVLLGDSITEMFTYHELFDEFTKETGIKVYNRGIGGDTSDRILERLETNVFNIEPKIIVFMVGINDLTIGAPAQVVADNIEKVILAIKERLPQTDLILETLTPVRNRKKGSNSQVDELNKLLEPMAEKYNLKFLRTHDLLLADDNELRKDFTYDGLHINAKAFEIVTGEILKLIK